MALEVGTVRGGLAEEIGQDGLAELVSIFEREMRARSF